MSARYGLGREGGWADWFIILISGSLVTLTGYCPRAGRPNFASPMLKKKEARKGYVFAAIIPMCL